MSERSERVRILTRITVIISISLLLVTAGSASCHDDRSPLISTLSPILSSRRASVPPSVPRSGRTEDRRAWGGVRGGWAACLTTWRRETRASK